MPASIDEYIAGFTPAVQRILEKVRETIAAAAPEARERISYRSKSRPHHSQCMPRNVDRP